MPSVSNGSTIVFEDDINLLEYLEKLHSVLGEFVVAIVEFNDYYADDEGGDALHNFRREIRVSLHPKCLFACSLGSHCSFCTKVSITLVVSASYILSLLKILHVS